MEMMLNLLTSSSGAREHDDCLALTRSVNPPDNDRLANRIPVATEGCASTGTSTRLLYIRDTLSGRKFLCDTGTQRSILPATVEDTAPGGHGPQLKSANDKDEYQRLVGEFPG
ncbi:unnamed protein product [Merluccius merluccius]